MRRIFPPFWLLLSLLLMTALHFCVPIQTIVPAPFHLVGAGLVVLGVLLVLWPARLFAKSKTTIKPFHESSTLVTSGPYRFSRNPIYGGMALALWGCAVLFGTLAPMLVVPLFVLLIDRVFIVGEERMLQAAFADDYTEYCRRVQRWI